MAIGGFGPASRNTLGGRQDRLQAAAALAPQVLYVHCKGVQRQPQHWVAVPLAESSAPWRAVLRGLPTDVPWAIEYPLVGDNLLRVVRLEIDHLRGVAVSMAGAARPRKCTLS